MHQYKITALSNELTVVEHLFPTHKEMVDFLMTHKEVPWALRDTIDDRVISTVFIPQIGILGNGYHFETAIFQQGESALIKQRYLTVEDATKGHQQCVADFVI